MLMQQNILICLILLTTLLAGLVYAQDSKPDFSGTWDLDLKKSRVVLLGTEERDLTKQKFNCTEKILIEHKEPELILKKNLLCEDKVTNSLKTIETMSKYFTDGRGEVNNISSSDQVESKTEWNGKKIIITIYRTNSANDRKRVFSTKELKISKDNQNLTEKSVISEINFPLASYENSFTEKVFKISK